MPLAKKKLKIKYRGFQEMPKASGRGGWKAFLGVPETKGKQENVSLLQKERVNWSTGEKEKAECVDS